MMDRIWSGIEWRRLRPGIKGLAIEYDDGGYQSVQVCVDWGPRYVAMSIMRFRDSASRISFFYSRPPQGVIQQTGAWEACAAPDGCCLRLVRCVQLRRGPIESTASFRAREAGYETMLRDTMRPILEAVI